MLLVTVGVILAVTLSPQDLQGTHDFRIAGSCDLSRMWPPSLSELQLETDAAANVLIFVPVGVAIGLARARPGKVGVLLAAIALPFAIEAVQFAVTPLVRACQSADVVDNLTGLLVGLVAGTIVAWLCRRCVVGNAPPDLASLPGGHMACLDRGADTRI